MSMNPDTLAEDLYNAFVFDLNKATEEEATRAAHDPADAAPRFDFFPKQLGGGLLPAIDTVCRVIADNVSRMVITHIQDNAEATVEVEAGIAVKTETTEGSATKQTGMTTATGVGTISARSIR